MGRVTKAGRKPKHRIEGRNTGPVQDFGTVEMWSKGLEITAIAARTQRHATTQIIRGVVLRDRVIGESGMVVGAGAFNTLQNPLDVLANRGLLGDEEQTKRRRDAAERLCELFTRAGIEGRTTATWNPAGGGGSREQDDASAEAEMAYYRACRAIKPYDALVSSVMCHHLMPPAKRQAIAAINVGLDLLHNFLSKSHFTTPTRARVEALAR